jgi:hypothetical protein
VVIVVDLGDDLQRCARQFAGFVFPHPPRCPQCAVSGQLATWARRSATLEVALADLGTVSSPAAQLVAAVPHLPRW